MGYKTAEDILPAGLLRRVQEYAAGETLYIPVKGKRRAWGELSGIRQELAARNARIQAEYRAGASLVSLADAYALSLDHVRRIVRGTKRRG